MLAVCVHPFVVEVCYELVDGLEAGFEVGFVFRSEFLLDCGLQLATITLLSELGQSFLEVRRMQGLYFCILHFQDDSFDAFSDVNVDLLAERLESLFGF